MSHRSVARNPAVTSKIMAAVKSKNSRPELALRRALHARGIRYRLHAADVMGRPDLVLRKYKIAIFVDGDLWHGNAWRSRGKPDLASLFPTRTEWWTSKIRANMARDRAVDAALTASGWHVIRIWESTIRLDAEVAGELIAAQIRGLKMTPNTYQPDSRILIDGPGAISDEHQYATTRRLVPHALGHITTPSLERSLRPVGRCTHHTGSGVQLGIPPCDVGASRGLRTGP